MADHKETKKPNNMSIGHLDPVYAKLPIQSDSPNTLLSPLNKAASYFFF